MTEYQQLTAWLASPTGQAYQHIALIVGVAVVTLYGIGLMAAHGVRRWRRRRMKVAAGRVIATAARNARDPNRAHLNASLNRMEQSIKDRDRRAAERKAQHDVDEIPFD